MIRQGIANRINRYAKNRGLEIIKIEEVESHYNNGYKFNRVRFITNDNEHYLFSEMDCNKRHWFIV